MWGNLKARVSCAKVWTKLREETLRAAFGQIGKNCKSLQVETCGQDLEKKSDTHNDEGCL